jgi:hypothetical protein
MFHLCLPGALTQCRINLLPKTEADYYLKLTHLSTDEGYKS